MWIEILIGRAACLLFFYDDVQVLKQAEAYPNLHECIITASKNLSLLTLDVVSFVLLCRLTLERGRTKVVTPSHGLYHSLVALLVVSCVFSMIIVG